MLSPQLAAPVPSSPVASEVELLARLRRGEVNLVSWRRELPPGLDAQLEAWVQRDLASFADAVPVRRCDLSPATRRIDEPARSWLTRDITALIARLARVAGARRLRVSFGAVRSDQCRKFHVDAVRYRLLTTYLGPGTEWVPDEAVSREALRRPPACAREANQRIVRDVTAVHRAVPGEVIVMKGGRHPGRCGAVHRSPPIEDTGQVRVVLAVSTLDGS